MIEVVIWSLITAITFGVINYLVKIITQKLSVQEFLILRTFIIGAILLPLEYFSTKFELASLQSVLMGVGLALLGYVGLKALMSGLRDGKLGVIEPVFAGRIVFSVLVGVLFLGDVLSVFHYLFIAVILLGVVMISINPKEFKGESSFLEEPGIKNAFIASLILGVTIPFFGYVGIINGVFLGAFVIEIGNLVGAAIDLSVTKDGWKNSFKDIRGALPLLFILGVIVSFGGYALIYSFSLGLESITAAILGTSALWATILGAAFLKERLLLRQYIAMVVIIGGVIGLSLV